MSIKRLDNAGFPDVSGNYVLYTEVEAMQAEHAKQLENAYAIVEGSFIEGWILGNNYNDKYKPIGIERKQNWTDSETYALIHKDT